MSITRLYTHSQHKTQECLLRKDPHPKQNLHKEISIEYNSWRKWNMYIRTFCKAICSIQYIMILYRSVNYDSVQNIVHHNELHYDTEQNSTL